MTSINQKIEQLILSVAQLDNVQAIGQSGDITVEPQPGESDIDIFIFCDRIPESEVRKSQYEINSSLYQTCDMQVCAGGEWGTGDVLMVDGVETMFMYFSIDDTLKDVAAILVGRQLDSRRGYYPIGRCATLRQLHVWYDATGFLVDMKKRLAVYPEELAAMQIGFHLAMVHDREDFGRAVRRQDVLFYHQVLECALDHYLQALFALNRVYFPSRKRTQQALDQFQRKPERCYARLLDAIRLGSSPEGIEQSYAIWCCLVDDLEHLRSSSLLPG
jgi:hypothetical protein